MLLIEKKGQEPIVQSNMLMVDFSTSSLIDGDKNISVYNLFKTKESVETKPSVLQGEAGMP